MQNSGLEITLSEEELVGKIMIFRGKKVMIDHDLARLYSVPTKRLKEQVKRNMERFPSHFMFELTKEENAVLRSHFATLKQGAHSKYLPFAFTEHGILQLSNVLKSEQAIKMSIRIIDVFIKLREAIAIHKDILLKLEKMEQQVLKNKSDVSIILDTLRQLLSVSNEPRKPIGYKSNR